MKIVGELGLRQSLALSQNMRLAIDMLAMNAMEIDEVIDEELLNNPCLQENENYLSFSEYGSKVPRGDGFSEFDVALTTASRAIDFREALCAQIGEGKFNVFEKAIAFRLINNLDDDGLLSHHEEVYADLIDELGVFDEWIDVVRIRIMDLDPIGCAAKTVIESLLHQARRLCRLPHQELMKLLREHENEVDKKISLAHVRRIRSHSALQELRKLQARPASRFDHADAFVPAIIPEVLVEQGTDGFMITLTRRSSERLMVKLQNSSRQQSFVREKHKRALFIMKALRFRETSLALIARAIVDHQAAWLSNRGPLKPLKLDTIAHACGVHESSVSRLTKGKFLSCNKGVFELKYFFSGHLGNESVDAPSSTAIKDHIKLIISKEDKTKPLSDQTIAHKLEGCGFAISRRTVTKYRESLDLPSANGRRLLYSVTRVTL